MAQIRITSDLTSLAQRLTRGGGSLAPALSAGAAAAKRLIRKFYREKPGRSFFASTVARGKVAIEEVTEQRAVITIDSRELAHRIRGGTVYPLAPRKALAIPLTEEARLAGYPKNNRIKGVFHPKGTNVLAVKDGKGIKALWALVARVTHRPHPEDAVPEGMLAAAAGSAMRERLLRDLKSRA